MPLRVVVIGAGVAGLQTARALTKAGLSVLVLEQGHHLGGVWARGYSGFGLQGEYRSGRGRRARA
jgi:phytoene dehydrogenase-like protein